LERSFTLLTGTPAREIENDVAKKKYFELISPVIYLFFRFLDRSDLGKWHL
jgi:hypothetical protein